MRANRNSLAELMKLIIILLKWVIRITILIGVIKLLITNSSIIIIIYLKILIIIAKFKAKPSFVAIIIKAGSLISTNPTEYHPLSPTIHPPMI